MFAACGWLGIRLDGTVPWPDVQVQVQVQVRRAWALTAPKRLQKG